MAVLRPYSESMHMALTRATVAARIICTNAALAADERLRRLAEEKSAQVKMPF